MIGRSLGPYEVREQLGEGGMGEVYLAEDTRLDRKVAIKVLPAGLNDDPERRDRFEREAKVIAGLGHPNICALFDVGSEDGVDFLVMELIEGETLGERLANGPLPLDEALEIGAQIAEGLDAAHQAGIVHRDLKPGNVMLTANGAKILDFGLAKAAGPQHAVEEVTVAATRLEPITTEGTIVGTLFYMSPEQLEAKDVDARSDIFSLGALLHEMVTGERPFGGESQASIIGSILKDEPARVSELRDVSPPPLDHVIRRCLAKKPGKRWQSARDVAGELEWIRTEKPVEVPSQTAPTPARSMRLPWAVAGVALLVAAAALASSTMGGGEAIDANREPVTFMIVIPEQLDLLPAMAFRPDGRQLAYILANDTGESTIWVRDFETGSSRSLPGTEGATDLFFSPDGEDLAFFANGDLLRMSVATAQLQRIARAPTPVGGSWGVNGDIIYGSRGTIWRVDAVGGATEQITELDTSLLQNHHDWPHFLPDGDRFLIQTDDPADVHATVQMRSLSSDEIIDLGFLPSNVEFAGDPGVLLFNPRGRFQMSVAKFSPDTAEIQGAPIEVTLDNLVFIVPHRRSVVLSPRGDVALQATPRGATRDLVIYDLAGTELDRITGAGNSNLAMSADGERLITSQRRVGEGFLSLRSPDGVSARVTSAPGNGGILSEDGSTLIYFEGSGEDAIYYRHSLDAGTRTPLPWSPGEWRILDISNDGQTLVMSARAEGRTLVLAPIDGVDLTSVANLPLVSGLGTAALSADGAWVAVADVGSTGTGRDVWLYSTRDENVSFQVSSAGGRAPFWSTDENTLFFIDDRGAVVAVELSSGAAGPSLPRRMFASRARASARMMRPCQALTDERIACVDTSSIDQTIEVRLNWIDTLTFE